MLRTGRNSVQKTSNWEEAERTTPLGESILNWYEFRRDSNLLEICGAGRSLSELFSRRVHTVVTASLPDRIPDQTFDYIVCLEIAENEKDPVSFLEKLKNHLRPGGILLLGGENRYGLKYFCGCGEKYTGLPYLGINGYPSEYPNLLQKGRLYSRQEWIEILLKAGLNKAKVYYPVPDNRFPQMIYTDGWRDATNAAERLVDYNYADPGMAAIEHRVFPDVISEGALPFMSNSFLFEATVDGNLSDIDYAVVTTDRGPERGLATTIRHTGRVVKRPLWKQGESHIRNLATYTRELEDAGVPVVPVKCVEDETGVYLDMPCVHYKSLSPVLTQAAVGDPKRFYRIFDRIFGCIQKSFSTGNGETGRCFLDLAPCNCFLVPAEEGQKEDILFYDQEFVTENGTPGFAMYRTLKYYFASSPEARKAIPIQEAYMYYGITPAMQEKYEKQEHDFIQSLRQSDRYRWLFSAATPDYRQLYKRACQMKAAAKKTYHIGYVPGVFDLFHTGHLRLIERCKERCDYLIVGVLTDELVEFYKGRPPVVSCEDRMNVIRGLKAVDEVIPVDFSNTDKLDAWEQIHYDCHFSGDDHVNHWNDVWQELKKRGSNMEFFSYTEGISSTSIKEKAGLRKEE